jgi:hypothetical protein
MPLRAGDQALTVEQPRSDPPADQVEPRARVRPRRAVQPTSGIASSSRAIISSAARSRLFPPASIEAIGNRMAGLV